MGRMGQRINCWSLTQDNSSELLHFLFIELKPLLKTIKTLTLIFSNVNLTWKTWTMWVHFT